jgi:hypothetical protein
MDNVSLLLIGNYNYCWRIAFNNSIKNALIGSEMTFNYEPTDSIKSH